MSIGRYGIEPHNLTPADVERLFRDFLRSQASRSSYAPKGTPWQAVDLPLVTAFPLNPQDRDEVNLLNETSDEVTRWVYVAKTARWMQIGGAPIGVLEWTGASTAPTGYVIADGSAISRTTYAGLFAIYGTTYGVGDGSTTFNVPDAVDRFIVGAGDTYARGATGGSATHVLGYNEMPIHSHTITSGGAHTHAPASGSNFYHSGIAKADPGAGTGAFDFGTSAAATESAGTHDHGGNTGNAGGSVAHENRPPYIALTPIIRT